MEILELKYKNAQNALATLEEILDEPFSDIVRDATIQRFEYTFEALKRELLQILLKAVFEKLFRLDLPQRKRQFNFRK